jgi:hypothetical protein
MAVRNSQASDCVNACKEAEMKWKALMHSRPSIEISNGRESPMISPSSTAGFLNAHTHAHTHPKFTHVKTGGSRMCTAIKNKAVLLCGGFQKKKLK